jgi:FMN-dependent NADH-azoreductase
MQLLHIDSSVLGPNSASRALSAEIVARQLALHPNVKVTHRDLAASRGNVYAAGSPAAALEHHESYLTGVLSFIGLTDITIVRAEGLAFGAEAKEAAMLKARENIAALAA